MVAQTMQVRQRRRRPAMQVVTHRRMEMMDEPESSPGGVEDEYDYEHEEEEEEEEYELESNKPSRVSARPTQSVPTKITITPGAEKDIYYKEYPATPSQSRYEAARQTLQPATSASGAGPSIALPPGASITDQTRPQSDSSEGLSPGTQHLLIAVGSIFGTLLIISLVFVAYRLRRGIPASQLFKVHPVSETRRGRWRPRSYPDDPTIGAGVDRKDWHDVDESVLPPPKPVISRNNTGVSHKTLGDTLSSQRRFRSPSPRREDLPLRKINTNPFEPSSPPTEFRRQSPTAQAKSSYEFADELTPLPHRSFMLGPREPEPAKESRFSWSTYVPPTPYSPLDGSNNSPPNTTSTSTAITNNEARHSAAPSMASSVPRFRTVDSWVAQQQGRLDLDQLRERERAREEVPEVPRQYRTAPSPTKGPRGVGTTAAATNARRGRRRGDSDSSAFRHHPGNQVDVARTSLVPSEILDKYFRPEAGL